MKPLEQSTKHLKKTKHQFLYNLFQKAEKEGTYAHLFYEASFILKPEKEREKGTRGRKGCPPPTLLPPERG